MQNGRYRRQGENERIGLSRKKDMIGGFHFEKHKNLLNICEPSDCSSQDDRHKGVIKLVRYWRADYYALHMYGYTQTHTYAQFPSYFNHVFLVFVLFFCQQQS